MIEGASCELTGGLGSGLDSLLGAQHLGHFHAALAAFLLYLLMPVQPWWNFTPHGHMNGFSLRAVPQSVFPHISDGGVGAGSGGRVEVGSDVGSGVGSNVDSGVGSDVGSGVGSGVGLVAVCW